MSATETPTGPATVSAVPGSTADRTRADDPVEDLLEDQRRRWARGDRVPAQAYLDRHPDIAAGDAAADLVYQEYLLLAPGGGETAFAGVLDRYPQFAGRLRLM